MAWNVYAVSTVTWGGRVHVDPASFSWSRGKNGGQSGQASFQLGDPAVAEIAGLYDVYPGRTALVLDWDGDVVYAGIIWDASYDYGSRELTVSHSDIWSLLAKRFVLTDRTPDMAKSKVTYSGLILRTIAKRVVQAGIAGTGYNLPIVFEPDVTGSSSRTYYGYDMETVTGALEEMMEQENGPDIDFYPRWRSDGSLEWFMRTGDLTYGYAEYDFAAEEPGARGLWIKTDASQIATRVYGIGEGTEVDTLVRVSSSSNIADYPAMEKAASFKDVKVGAQLQGLAQEDLRANNQTTRQAGFDIRADGVYKVTDIRPGTPIRWNVRGDPYFTTGYREWELIKYSGSLDNWVKLEFQQKGG